MKVVRKMLNTKTEEEFDLLRDVSHGVTVLSGIFCSEFLCCGVIMSHVDCFALNCFFSVGDGRAAEP